MAVEEDGDLELDILDSIDESREVVLSEVSHRDGSDLPHLYIADLIVLMFPTAVAVPEREVD